MFSALVRIGHQKKIMENFLFTIVNRFAHRLSRCVGRYSRKTWQILEKMANGFSLKGILVFWSGFIGVGVWAFQSGDPSKLLYPTNSFGQICGQANLDDHKSIIIPSSVHHPTIIIQHHTIILPISYNHHTASWRHYNIIIQSSNIIIRSSYYPLGRSIISSFSTLLWPYKGGIEWENF